MLWLLSTRYKIQMSQSHVTVYIYRKDDATIHSLTSHDWAWFSVFELKIERYILYVIFTGLHIIPENNLEMGTWSTHQFSLQNFCITAWSLTWEYYLRKTYTTALLLDYEWLRWCKKTRRKSQTTANPHLLQRLHSWNIPQSMKLQYANFRPYEKNCVGRTKDRTW